MKNQLNNLMGFHQLHNLCKIKFTNYDLLTFTKVILCILNINNYLV